MSTHIRDALADLERDVAGLRLATSQDIRTRGRARRRRQAGVLAATVVAGVAVSAVVVAPLYRGWGGSDGQPGQVAAEPIPSSSASSRPSDGCASSSTPPTKSVAESDDALARSPKARVFLKSTAGPAEKAAVDAALRTLNTVTAIEFRSHEQQWQRFAVQFCDTPDLVAATKPEDLPEVFDITLASPEDYPLLQATIGPMTGVDDVVRVPSNDPADDHSTSPRAR